MDLTKKERIDIFRKCEIELNRRLPDCTVESLIDCITVMSYHGIGSKQ